MKRIACGCLVAICVYEVLAISVAIHVHRSNQARADSAVDNVLRMANIPRTDSVELVEHIDTYTKGIAIPPGGADGTREVVLRIPVEEAKRILSSAPPDGYGRWLKQKPQGLRRWKSLEKWFLPLRNHKGEPRFALIIRGPLSPEGRISNCDLIVVDVQRGLFGYYRRDM
ncbi:hypothetical protein CA54_24080 [Symmachiella macrocystis]|uniref:Uncharacterized protein n=1 Tax=Symmachiella macrocystis TaxID=2527985 RepID=A0A5C6BN50_9PLAN|nr:hypothetical protein [Symmachiella macrocystis]TWU13573.1 hypothetical protein CA54_24080 [Symmachiella macrocystis]